MHHDTMVRVLGPIDVLTPSGPVVVVGRQARSLLGALAIGADDAVPIDYLNQVVWGVHPPTSARNTLQSHISHLRHVLGADAIIRVDHSYRLTAGVENLDALLFERLLLQATESKEYPEKCRAVCREALALWRGRPFGDLVDDEGFQLEAFRLDELRLAAMELRLAADLSLGNHGLVVGELESAVEEHPYREHLWYLLIEALDRCGRRVEALRACARLRRVLAEVGLEASGELLSIEQGIVAGHTIANRNNRAAPTV